MSIVVCVPWVKAHKKFLAQFPDWYAYEKPRHDLILNWQSFRPLYEVQAESVMLAQERQASHVLFVEDDQWGFPAGGIEELIEQDKDAIGFNTYRKRWPYKSLAMNKINKSLTLLGRHPNLRPHEQEDGPEVQPTDMITWAFTIVKMPTFERLYEADKFPFNCQGPNPTDSYFNQYCEDINIPRLVHFGHVIGHGDVLPEDRDILRKAGNEIQKRKRKQVSANEPADIYVEEELYNGNKAEQVQTEFYARNPELKVA